MEVVACMLVATKKRLFIMVGIQCTSFIIIIGTRNSLYIAIH